MASIEHVPDRGPTYITATAVITSIDFILVAFRLLWRSIVQQSVGTDDVFIGLAMASQIVITVVGDLACRYSFGRHRSDIPKSGGNVVLGLKYFWLFQILYKLTICFNKLSLLSLYLRLFPSKTFRTLCYVTIAIIVGGSIGFIFATVFQCIPVYASWHKQTPGMKCIDNAAFRWSWAAYNTASDIWIFLMPLPRLARLQLDRTRKAGLIVIFSLGLFVCITSIVRMVYIAVSTTTSDPTWGSFDALLWSAIEPGTGIICACLPYLKHPLQRAFPNVFSTLGSSGNSRSKRTYGDYGLSSGNPRSRVSRPRAPGDVFWPHGDGVDNWAMVANEGRPSADSREPIATGQILMKTDFEMQTHIRGES
ncbi:hypothetical protein ASPVEDRAFT_80895 [Aspergillus versicolor CBS 583.65]|uniref:Rhodopsin domain-containing protein n=1 Tax=Aspergillus versicolor CBS 583.65 TaxID=1036611 RepID=A0A1L9PCN1_ASPVE|nr:uncharacterized protein ASPVEDRAFT_80895 [Aspergillus versicolor CBS 583.65]OJI99279.1 hypothetical protein ASPVEDRAFT_80895 [Aspergillus versicolor CBS 583.65]